tara:strand:- start:3005 stop:3355 length:351 start_codon:yes stop_codon:yes gene_type:complete
MQTSSPRFKSLAVTTGLSFWFFIITSTTGLFSLEYFFIFIAILLTLTQIFTKKLSKGLDLFAIINTKIFVGALFVFLISIYGISFRLLRIDMLRLRKQSDSYWLEMENSQNPRKQY